MRPAGSLGWLLGVLLTYNVSAAFHVSLIVSVCKETNLHFVDTAVQNIHHCQRNVSTEVFFYCKCTRDRTADGRQCVNLPNVGRESATHLTHIVANYENYLQSSDHLLFFINGGSGSKSHAVEDINNIVKRLCASEDALAYTDSGFSLSIAERDKQLPDNRTNAEYVKLAMTGCFEGGDTETPLPFAQIKAEGKHCPCRFGPNWCETFPPAVCPDGQKLTFQSQRDCSWIGHSRCAAGARQKAQSAGVANAAQGGCLSWRECATHRCTWL